MTHKFGIKVPKTVEEALTVDKENGNGLWYKAIQKEMSAAKEAFKILDDDERPPIGSQYMKCHMVFSIKMEGFSRNACLVAGGHMVEAPKSLTYASMVSRESFRIAMTWASLNDLEVNCLCIQHSAEEELSKIDKFFKMKGGSIGDPNIYLGAKVKQMKMNIGVTAWAISPSKYVDKAVNNCEKWIQENIPEHKHSSRATNPFPTDYDPDLDTTNELDEDQGT